MRGGSAARPGQLGHTHPPCTAAADNVQAALDSHAAWLRSLRQQMAQASQGRGCGSMRAGPADVGATWPRRGHRQAQGRPVRIALDDERTILIQVQRDRAGGSH